MFNIRVYGILINEKSEVLVSDELIHGIIEKYLGHEQASEMKKAAMEGR